MTKGLWRIDYLALADISSTVEPIRLFPAFVKASNGEDSHLVSDLSQDDNRYLASFPGDVFELGFVLPYQAESYELFLLTRGYYLEWIRPEWLKEKDIGKLKKLVLNDKAAWESLALEYKSDEAEMESVFWDSKLFIP